jgi:hypothetical protein
MPVPQRCFRASNAIDAWYEAARRLEWPTDYRDAKDGCAHGRQGVIVAWIVIDLDRRIFYATDGQPDGSNFGTTARDGKGAPPDCFLDVLDKENPA